MKQPSGWGLIRSSCVCATLPIAIRTPVGHGAEIVCSNAITSAPSVSAGGGGPSKARPAAQGGGSVGGMASTLYPAIRQASKMRVRLESDGSLLVQCGTQDMGSRTYSALGQITANGLGIPMSKVAVEPGDTWLTDGPFFRWLASEGQHFPGGGYGDRETTHDADPHGSRRQGVTPCRLEDGGSGFPRRSDPQPGPAMWVNH
jgi:hypothetical protein